MRSMATFRFSVWVLEEPQGSHHLDEGRQRHFLLFDQEQLIQSNVLGTELIRWFAEMF